MSTGKGNKCSLVLVNSNRKKEDDEKNILILSDGKSEKNQSSGEVSEVGMMDEAYDPQQDVDNDYEYMIPIS